MRAIRGTAWRATRQSPAFQGALAALLVGLEVFTAWFEASATSRLVPWFIIVPALHRLLPLGEGGMGRVASPGVAAMLVPEGESGMTRAPALA